MYQKVLKIKLFHVPLYESLFLRIIFITKGGWMGVVYTQHSPKTDKHEMSCIQDKPAKSHNIQILLTEFLIRL